MGIIGEPPGGLEHDQARGEWCVRVSISTCELVPSELLHAWIALETFCRDQPTCWPSNKAVAARMGLKNRAAQLALETLDDHGLIERLPLPGNRRSIRLLRRTSETLTASEWKALADRAGLRAAGRSALASNRKAERKVHRPKIRIVS